MILRAVMKRPGTYVGRTDPRPIDPAHFHCFESLRADDPESDDHIFVHACYYPNRTMAEQSGPTHP